MEQAWGRWSYSPSLDISPNTLDGQQSSMWQGRSSVDFLLNKINGRASSLVWVVLWFFLVADTPSKVAPIPSCKTFPIHPRGQRYILIIHFYVESGQKMIQFNIQFKVESFNSKNYSIQNWTKIFIQKIIQIGKIISAWENREKHAQWAFFSSKWAHFACFSLFSQAEIFEWIIFLNEYSRFNFELNIELNHFLARFNVKMNNQNVSATPKPRPPRRHCPLQSSQSATLIDCNLKLMSEALIFIESTCRSGSAPHSAYHGALRTLDPVQSWTQFFSLYQRNSMYSVYCMYLDCAYYMQRDMHLKGQRNLFAW